MHRGVFVLVVAAAIAAATSGAAGASEDRAVRSLLESRQQNVVLQEWDTSCGAAALATLLRYQFGDLVTERIVALGILRGTDPDRVRGRGGFSLLDLKRLAESRGFAADGYAQLTTGQLLRLAPLIVAIESYAGDHFVVFRGVVRGQAVLADPAFGNRSLAFDAFESQWKARLGFVVKPKGGKDANRLLATRRDVLRVEDDTERAALDEPLPKPLTDAQLARTFASDTNAATAPGTLTPAVAGSGSQRPGPSAAAGSLGSTAGSGAAPAPLTTAVSGPSGVSVSVPPMPTTSPTMTITSPIASPTITTPSVTIPSVPLPSVGIAVSVPPLRPGGR